MTGIRRSLFGALLGSFVVHGMVGCDEPTSIAVHLSADMPCAALKGVVISAMPPGAVDGPTVTATRCVDGATEAEIGTLVVVPSGANDAKVLVRIVVGVDRPVAECSSATGYEGCIIARRTLRFVPQREIDLPVAIRAQCKGVSCDGVSTCVRGGCRPAKIPDPADCSGVACDEDALEGTPIGPPVTLPDGGIAPVLPNGTVKCGASEKLCGNACVINTDPQYGCSAAGCEPCAGAEIGDYLCTNATCLLASCKAGFKKCGDACVPTDVAHGCGGASCNPCSASNGTPSCGATGACELTCSPGFKLCGGVCVNVNDPTYGCAIAGCSATSCPNPGPGGTLVCESGLCVVGACPAATKNCNQKCVPTDVNNGCADPARCASCGPQDICQGSPVAVCTCIPTTVAVACSGLACGPADRGCGVTVASCGTCAGPKTCGGGGAGPNGCGCTPQAVGTTCAGKNCGAPLNNCGTPTNCGACTGPNSCGGAGVQFVCGCTPTLNCSGQCGYYDDGCGTQTYCGDCGGSGD